MPRRRRRGGRNQVRKQQVTPVNSYPWMSWPEALVYHELVLRKVPFTHRYFKVEWSPTLKTVIPDFHPEFTLPDYKVVILIQGAFFGTIPGAIDRNSLAKVSLEHDGWKVPVWHEVDVRQDLQRLFDRDLPQLRNPAIRGPVIQNPYGPVNYISRLKTGNIFRRPLIIKSRGTRVRSGRRRFRRRRTGGGTGR